MPLTGQEYKRLLGRPPLCEQLKVRDITDDLLREVIPGGVPARSHEGPGADLRAVRRYRVRPGQAGNEPTQRNDSMTVLPCQASMHRRSLGR